MPFNLKRSSKHFITFATTNMSSVNRFGGQFLEKPRDGPLATYLIKPKRLLLHAFSELKLKIEAVLV